MIITDNLFKKPLVIIDGFGIFFRTYYAYQPIIGIDNLNFNAIFGFAQMMARLIKYFHSHDIYVALDNGSVTFRDKIFPNYKANRKETPDDLRHQFSIMKDFLEFVSISNCSVNGYEADDIIATYVKQAKDSRNITIVSLDKDLTQLLKYRNVSIYDFAKKKKLLRDDVFNKFGVMPEYITDYLGLIGDTSDNIPGVKSIGPKTATDLINSFGNLNSIYSNLSSIKSERTKKALRDHKELAFMSKFLATLKEDIDLPHINDINFNDINFCKSIEFFDKYKIKFSYY